MKMQPLISAAKRLGLAHCPWMGDWFVSWSPRNSNRYGEGAWHHWVNLAAWILSHEYTEKVAPQLYRPELREKYDPEMYTEANRLPKDDLPNANPYEDEDW